MKLKRVLHLVIQDFKRMKYLFFAWVALSFIHLLAVTGGLDGVISDSGTLHFLKSQTYKFILLVIWMPFLVQPDRLTPDTSFLGTRPVSGGELPVSKFLYVFVFICGVQCLWEIVVPFISNPAWSFGTGLFERGILNPLIMIVPLWVVALLTPDFQRYTIVGFVLMLFYLLLGHLLFGGLAFTGGVAASGADVPVYYSIFNHLDQGRLYGISKAGLFSLLMGLAVILHHYLSRNTRRSVVMAFAVYAILISGIPSTLNMLNAAPEILSTDTLETAGKAVQPLKTLSADALGIGEIIIRRSRYGGAGKGSSTVNGRRVHSYNGSGRVHGIPGELIPRIIAHNPLTFHHKDKTWQETTVEFTSSGGGFISSARNLNGLSRAFDHQPVVVQVSPFFNVFTRDEIPVTLKF